MDVEMIYCPGEEELKLCKRAIWVTMGKVEEPKTGISKELLRKILVARHSPIRVLNFGFLFRGIPSNIATHLVRHIHAVPFVSSLRNDRQDRMDGDLAPRNTPVDMILYCNAEELMTIANKRLCMKASKETRFAVQRMCELAEEKFPEFKGLFVPMCEWHGNVCHEIDGCGKHGKNLNWKIINVDGLPEEDGEYIIALICDMNGEKRAMLESTIFDNGQFVIDVDGEVYAWRNVPEDLPELPEGIEWGYDTDEFIGG